MCVRAYVRTYIHFLLCTFLHSPVFLPSQSPYQLLCSLQLLGTSLHLLFKELFLLCHLLKLVLQSCQSVLHLRETRRGREGRKGRGRGSEGEGGRKVGGRERGRETGRERANEWGVSELVNEWNLT